MNYIESIVKILESPKYKKIGKHTYFAEFRAQLPQIQHCNQMVRLIFWDNLATDVVRYYEKNDYIIIEGYISVRIEITSNLVKQSYKKIEVTVLKIYPFLLNTNYLIQKTSDHNR